MSYSSFCGTILDTSHLICECFIDPITNRLCPERLPSTTQPAVRLFYASLQAGEIDDISTKPLAKTRQSPSKEKASATSSTYSGKKVGSKSRDADQQVTPGAKAETASVSVAEAVGVQYWEATSAGQAWFNLCSALPRGPQYLSSAAVRAGDGEAATEAPYELQPTMRNVCATLRVLLGLQRVAPVNSNNPGAVQEEDAYWSLKDVEDSWNEHVRTQASNKSGQDHAREICTTQGVVRFRAPFSDTEMIMRDVGSISFVGGRHSIDLELESAHQLATVKHRLGAADSTGWNNEAIMRIAQQYKDSARSVLCGSDSTQQRPPAVVVSVSSIVQSAVLGDRKLVILLELLREHSSVRSAQVDALVVDAITAARWGEERRTGADFAHSSSNVGSTASKGARVSSSGAGGGAVLSVTDASLTSADAQLRRQEGVQATLRALEAITHCSDPVLTAQLVHWMLQEAPQEVTVYQVASVLMRLDLVVRSHALFRSNLREVFAPGTEEGEGKARGRVQLLRHVLSFGTPQCPSKSFFFQSLPGSNAMSLYDRVRLFKLYFLFRLAK